MQSKQGRSLNPERKRTNKAPPFPLWSVVAQAGPDLLGKENFEVDQRLVFGFIFNWTLEYLKIIVLISIFVLFYLENAWISCRVFQGYDPGLAYQNKCESHS